MKDDEILTPVMGDGKYAPSLPLFGGLSIWDANGKIIAEMDRRGVLFHKETYTHSYMVMSGSPKTVLDKLVEFVDYVGGPFGGLVACFKEWDDAKIHQNSLRLLAENVMPKLRDYCASKVAAE